MVLVTTIKFDKVVEIGDPKSQAKIYEAQAADELIFVDIAPTANDRKLIIEILRSISEEIFIPITVGGGVKYVSDFRELLSNGADKVSINSAAVNNPALITQASEAFGAQCVVVSIDYKKNEDGTYAVWSESGKTKTLLNPVSWAKECEKLGAGEILLTCIDKDGTHQGLELEVSREIADSLSIPVILSGGCGLASHFIDGFKIAHVDAVSAGTFFCFKDQNPIQTRAHIRNAGVPIRIYT
jgi:cyclase